MREFDFIIHGDEYHVELKSLIENIAELEVNGTSYSVEIKQMAAQKAKTPILVRSTPSNVPVDNPKTSKPTDPVGAGKVLSPLPGVVLSINVNVGDKVKNGDVLLIMEAMKMENEIRTDISGTIKLIQVKPNDTVLEGDVLVVIEG
jgi:glutaconyl-CoA/methylmalonyl-CoA decarboxylase subunit gamma